MHACVRNEALNYFKFLRMSFADGRKIRGGWGWGMRERERGRERFVISAVVFPWPICTELQAVRTHTLITSEQRLAETTGEWLLAWNSSKRFVQSPTSPPPTPLHPAPPPPLHSPRAKELEGPVLEGSYPEDNL